MRPTSSYVWPTLLAAAIGLSAIATAKAGLTINLRFPSGATQMPVNGVYLDQDLPIEVWASITSASGVNGSGELFGLTYAYYSIISQRLVAGPNGSIGGNLTGAAPVAPFDGVGSQPGLLFNLNADGITDLGSPLGQPVEINLAKPRSASPTLSSDAAATVRPIAGGFEFLVERVLFHVDSTPGTLVAGNGTRFNPQVPLANSLAAPIAVWYQRTTGEGSPINNGFNNDDALVVAGTSVTFVAGPPWQNLIRPLDVDNNTRVEPLDVLQVVNDLNARGFRDLPAPSGGRPPPYLDTTGDNRTSPQDVLLIVNHLNSLPPGAAAAVPEPQTAVLALWAAGVVAAARRRAKMQRGARNAECGAESAQFCR